MKFICDKSSFSDAVSVLSRIIPSHSPTPALMGIFIKTTTNGISMYGYDLDIGISTNLDAYVEESGEIILPARLLSDISRKAKGDRIIISASNNNVAEIICDNANFTIPGYDTLEYPDFPTIDNSQNFKIPQNMLYSMVDQTIFAVGQVNVKPIFTGSLFDIENGFINIVSVDGLRLAIRKERIANDFNINFVVPGKTLNELLKIIDSQSDEEIDCFVNDKKILFKTKNYEIFSRLLEGTFYDYKAAISLNSENKVKVNTKDLIDAVDRVSLVINETGKSPIRLKINKEEIVISTFSSLGNASDKVSASYNGERIEIGFNSKYIIDALKNSDSDEVYLEIAGVLSPMKVLPINGDHFLFLVLPVRLRNEA